MSLMNRTVQAVNRRVIKIKQFLRAFTRSDWISILGSLGSAFIAAFISLFVVYLQNSHEKTKEQQQQKETEDNKLRYLNFLIQDSYKVVEFYNSNAINIGRSFRNNPFVLPDYVHHNGRSLDIIVNRLNQEEYYLASVNRLEREEIAEVFLLLNAIHEQNKNAQDHYFKEFPEAIKNKTKLSTALRDLSRNINQELRSISLRQAIGEQEKAVFYHLKELQESAEQILPNRMEYDLRLLNSNDLYIQRVIDILNPHSNLPSLRKLLLEAYDAQADYEQYVNHWKNVVNFIGGNQKEINYEYERIKEIIQPFDAYVRDIKNHKGE